MTVSLPLQFLNAERKVAPFPTEESPIILGAFTYEAKRMGGAPTITATIMYPSCLDNLWTDETFVEFNGERYYLKQVPTSGYSDAQNVYKHENVAFVAERSILDTVYFYDVVDPDMEIDRPISHSSNVVFFGTIHEFADRLNRSLEYAGLDYSVVVDAGITSEGKLMSFTDQFFSNVLQEVFKTYDLPYYFNGKIIHIGFASGALEPVFEYGVENALLSIKKTNANNKIVNRCTGIGSGENIPYYYPNPTPKGWVSVGGSVGSSADVLSWDKFARMVREGESIQYSEQGYGFEFGAMYFDKNEEDETADILESGANFVKVGAYSSNLDGEGTASALVRIHIPFTLDQDIPSYSITLRVADCWVDYAGKAFVPALQTYAQLYQDNGTLLRTLTPIAGSDAARYHKYDCEWTAKGSYELVVEIQFSITTMYTSGAVFYAQFETERILPTTRQWIRRETGEVVRLRDLGLSLPDGSYSDGDTLTLVVDRYIIPQTNLMPSVYRESSGAERFYNAINETYINPDTGEYYVFSNPYTEGHPKEHIATFDDIKPTLTDMRNGEDLRMDMFTAFAYDLNDNDEVDDDGNYQHPYFFGKLRKFDGEHGFNLFEQAIEGQDMTVAMTSGPCGGCQFVIGVADMEDGTQANTVQVDADGNLLYDNNGNVRCGREHVQNEETPQPQQNDTRNNEVWIALLKDDQTFGVPMPNASNSYRPSANDTFVLLNINMPEAYVTAAEEKLEEQIIQHMAENNDEKFKFSIAFSRIYLAAEPDVYAALDENARIKIAYNEAEYELFVSSYTYRVTEADILPEISVELSDTLTISQNPLQAAISQVKGEINAQLLQLDVASLMSGTFLRKDIEDVALAPITFQEGLTSAQPIQAEQGIHSPNAVQGYKGFSVFQDETGAWHIDTDYLNVRRKWTAAEVEIQKTYHIGGAQIKSSASLICRQVEETEEGYVCYMDTTADDGSIAFHGFVPGDLAFMQTFNLVRNAQGVFTNRFYWRKVLATGSSSIVLSKTECARDSDIPMPGDHIVQLGYNGETAAPERQVAVIDAGAGTGAPYYRQYVGIGSNPANPFTLPEPETQLKPNANVLTGIVHIQPGSTGADSLTDLPKFIQDALDDYDFDFDFDVDFSKEVFGKQNLLRNSGFNGDYLSKQLSASTNMSGDDALFSPSLVHWGYENVEALKTDESQSGVHAHLGTNGQLSQNLMVKIIGGDQYMMSFKAKGTGPVTFSVAGVTKTVDITTDYNRYVIPVKAATTGTIFTISGNDCYLCELQLERGTVASAWGYSIWDNTTDLAYYQAIKYIYDAIVDGSTTIAGGLILTNLLMLGNYKDKQMQKVTAGINGTYKEDTDVAFWAGGSLAQAIATIAFFLEHPHEHPSDEAWETELANFAVTHGGDVFLRGYINALGGFFRGTVDIANKKILLNADGSGHFANGNVQWDSFGRVKKSAPDSIMWTMVDAYSGTGVVDYSKGSYLILAYNPEDDPGNNVHTYSLETPLFEGYTVIVRNDDYDATMPAYLSGTFYYYAGGDKHTAPRLRLDTSKSEKPLTAELVYSIRNGWEVQTNGTCSIENDTLMIR